MSRERKIPERFLVADRAAVEDALRRGIRAALRSHGQSDDLIASWKGGRVVFVPAAGVYSLKPSPGREAYEDHEVLMRAHERTSLLFNVRNVYVRDDTFHVVYASRKVDAVLYRRPEAFARELRDICRELTGRDLAIRVVEEDAPEGEDLLVELPKATPRAEPTLRDAVLPPARVLHPERPREPPFGGNQEGAAGDAPSRRDS